MELPKITIKSISHLVDQVAVKYPTLPKIEITAIIVAFFSILRDLLIAGHSVSINKLFNNLEFHHYDRFYSDTIEHTVKAKLKTPRDFNDK